MRAKIVHGMRFRHSASGWNADENLKLIMLQSIELLPTLWHLLDLFDFPQGHGHIEVEASRFEN